MVSLAFRFYQKYITDLDDSRCHYTPTCSVYSAWALRKYGFFKGLLMSSDRLIRCHTGQTEYRYDPPIDY
ncbi:MAG: membrane protein insertion efficiency factor YidD [Candidatus Hydrogenedentota bacterium]|nr:MAG: membrane protein insertion efficiency factor YidD [Candidatus Hydrogenedentota bacterium]